MQRSRFRLAILPLAASLLAAPRSTPAQALPENLVADGIPELPKDLAARVLRYGEARSAGIADWHPARREMLISTRFGDTAQVHRVAQPMGARQQVTFEPDAVGGASWFPDGSAILFSKSVGGNEQSQLYRLELASRAVTLLTDGKSKFEAARWSEKGDQLAYRSTQRNGRDEDIWVMNPRDPASARLVYAASGSFTPLDWSPDDRRLLLVEDISINQSYLHLLDLATGTATPLTPRGAGEPVAYSGGAFLPGGTAILTTSDRGSEFRRLVRREIATGVETPVGAAESWDVDAFSLSHDGRRVAYVVNQDGFSTLRIHDFKTGKTLRPANLPEGLVGGLDWRRDGSELGFTVSSPAAAGDVWSLEIASGRVTRWTESETGYVDPANFPAPELHRVKSFDGLEVPLFLYRPPARFTGPRPVVIRIHGGPEGQARPGYLGRNAYYLQELGVALLDPNVRGSTGYGKRYLQLDNGRKREDSVKDIGAVLDWIATDPGLDPSRVLVAGGSYGGYMTLASLVHYSDRLRGGIDTVGIANFVTFLKNTSDYRRDLRRVEYGDERDPDMAAFLESIAPANRADKISAPLFVIQGLNDPRVPASEAELIVKTVRAAGKPVWYLLAKDEGHGFRKKRNLDYSAVAQALFIEQRLLR